MIPENSSQTALVLLWKKVDKNLQIKHSEMARLIPQNCRKSRKSRNDGKFHENHQILNQSKRCINKLCLGNISGYKTVRIKFSVDSGFSNKHYDKKRKHGNVANQHKAF